MKIKILIIVIALTGFGALLFFSTYSLMRLPPKEMILIPEGEFFLGSNDIDELNPDPGATGVELELNLENEEPSQKLFLKSFKIDKYEVTNEEYKVFLDKNDYPAPATWAHNTFPSGKGNHPVNNVTWLDAYNFCEWMRKRLPTEMEWEKAAKGPDGTRYPWGNEYDIKKANFEKGDTMEVGSMPYDKSGYGVYDMAGNVMEWTGSWYKPYPGSTFKAEEYGETNRVLRGWSGTDVGHYNVPDIFSRNTSRHFYVPEGMGDDFGFRCVKDV